MACGDDSSKIESVKKPTFGTRYLLKEDQVFEHNAWDHVKWSDEQQESAEKIVFEQHQTPVSEEKAKDLMSRPAEFWDDFYQFHDTNFFMDRKWLLTEFPELIPDKGSDECQIEESEPYKIENDKYAGSLAQYRIWEVGCGVGNTVFPLLHACPNPKRLFVYCCDFSEKAVNLVQANENYHNDRCLAFVCDITNIRSDKNSSDPPFPPKSIDVISCIFILSAITPENHHRVLINLVKYLKPGGLLLFKDYGQYDMTQLRFKKERAIANRKHLYARGDGTFVYYFSQSELDGLFIQAGLTKEQNIIDHRLVVNRKKQIKMYRVWVQCKYRKPQ